MLSRLIQSARFLLVCSFIGSYFVITIPLFPFLILAPYRTRKLVAKIIQIISSIILKILRVEVDIRRHADSLHSPKGNLIICNHLSYLDVLVLVQYAPACFVTSVEVKETPVLGQICILAGCLFVERRDRSRIHKEIHEITKALQEGLNVLIFPEATSSNGADVLRFRRPLFQASLDAKAVIQPLALRYESIDGEPFGDHNRDRVCWYGDMDFLPHFWLLHQTKGIRAKIQCLPTVRPELYSDLSTLAGHMHTAVRSAYL